MCALIAVYRRRRAQSRHLGRPGAWLDIVVMVERIAEQPSARHGTVRRHDFVDIAGNRLVWWQTRGAALPLGQAVHLRRASRAPHPYPRRRGHGAGPLPTARSSHALGRPSPARASSGRQTRARSLFGGVKLIREEDALASEHSAVPTRASGGERARRRAATRVVRGDQRRPQPIPRPGSFHPTIGARSGRYRLAQTLGCHQSRRRARSARPHRRDRRCPDAAEAKASLTDTDQVPTLPSTVRDRQPAAGLAAAYRERPHGAAAACAPDEGTAHAGPPCARSFRTGPAAAVAPRRRHGHRRPGRVHAPGPQTPPCGECARRGSKPTTRGNSSSGSSPRACSSARRSPSSRRRAAPARPRSPPCSARCSPSCAVTVWVAVDANPDFGSLGRRLVTRPPDLHRRPAHRPTAAGSAQRHRARRRARPRPRAA